MPTFARSFVHDFLFLIEIEIANPILHYFFPGSVSPQFGFKTMADSEALSMVDPSIFKSLQNTIDNDSSVKEKFKDILQTLEKQGMNEYIHDWGDAHLISATWKLLLIDQQEEPH